jgi:ABC-type transporter Mla MlaB component
MLKINDSTNGDLFIDIETNTLDKTAGERILREVPQFFGEGKSIVLNLSQVTDLTSEGFNALYDLMKKAGVNRSYIRFTNVHDNYSEKIHTLTTTSEG